jgi:hypothetical protein
MDFEDVGRQPADNFAGNSQINLWFCFWKSMLCIYFNALCICCFFILDVIGVVVYVSKIKKKGLYVKQPYVHVVLMNHRYLWLCTCNFFSVARS